MATRTESVWCHECDHEHECEVVHEEFDTYLDVPDECEGCGEPLIGSGPSDASLRSAERRQMGCGG